MYDVWLPELAPSRALLKERPFEDRQLRRYRAEMRDSAISRHLIALLARLSHETDLTVGCFCPDEKCCHRSILRELLIEAGAMVL